MEIAAELAQAYYSNRLAPDWRRPNAEQVRALFDRLGLTADFWQL